MLMRTKKNLSDVLSRNLFGTEVALSIIIIISNRKKGWGIKRFDKTKPETKSR